MRGLVKKLHLYLPNGYRSKIQAGTTARSKKMANQCMNCARTEAQVIADAKSLGLTQEFQSGVYNCCQISEWADEQWLAWFQATQEDIERLDELTLRRSAFGDTGPVLVPVRFNRPQVPWYRSPEDPQGRR
jgi:hypothetical protein